MFHLIVCSAGLTGFCGKDRQIGFALMVKSAAVNLAFCFEGAVLMNSVGLHRQSIRDKLSGPYKWLKLCKSVGDETVQNA